MTRFQHFAGAAERTFAFIGLALSTAIVAGLLADVRSFDRTSGGETPPYTDYQGTPMDWSVLDTTVAGMVARGHVVDVLVDCTSGMMTFQAAGITVPFRVFSERALAIHKPREACRARGFVPAF